MRLYCHFGALVALSACVGGFFFGFCFVAVVAECLQVVEVVCTSACDVADVVNF